MFPSKKQWQQWSLPSKYTTLGLFISILSLVIGIVPFIYSNTQNLIDINTKVEVKPVVYELQNEQKIENQYVKRYLKERLAEIENVTLVTSNGNWVARLYYDSFWEKLTSSFWASVEIRHITDLNKIHETDEDWEKAFLINHMDDYEHAFFIGESEYVELRNLKKGQVYEVRIVDFNYDSDEPPTLPFRFQT